jgi:hypothetical protein
VCVKSVCVCVCVCVEFIPLPPPVPPSLPSAWRRACPHTAPSTPRCACMRRRPRSCSESSGSGGKHSAWTHGRVRQHDAWKSRVRQDDIWIWMGGDCEKRKGTWRGLSSAPQTPVPRRRKEKAAWDSEAPSLTHLSLFPSSLRCLLHHPSIPPTQPFPHKTRSNKAVWCPLSPT